MNIKQAVKKFFATLKPMTWAQRAEHIIYHYKAHILYGAVILFVCLALLISALTPRKESLLSGISVNADMTQKGVTYLTTQLEQKLGADPKRQTVSLTFSGFESMNSTAQVDRNYNRAMGIFAQVDKGQLDYMIMDLDALDFYATQEVFEDLTQLLPRQMLDQFTLIYARAENEEEEYPIAITITDLPFTQECVEHDKGVYIGFPGNTDREFTPEEIMQYLIDWS